MVQKAQNHCTCSWNVCCDVEKRKAIVEEQRIKPIQPIRPIRPMQEEKLVQNIEVKTIEQPKATIKQPQEAIEQPKATIKQPQQATQGPKAEK